MNDSVTPITVIRPKSGWQVVDLKELRDYRDLLYFLVWRDIKVLYAQTVLGLSWAILNPLVQIVVFSVVFGRVAKLNTEGIPYALFSTIAIIPWTYMSEAMTLSSQSLITGQQMLGKIYFPRLIYPLTGVLSKLVDFGISLFILLPVLIYYRITPTWNLIFLPLFFVLMLVIPAGIGMWLSAMAIRYRDVKYAMSFVVKMLIYSAPIVYSASKIPGKYRLIYSLNPIVAVVEGYRSCLLGTPMPWQFIWPGTISAILLIVGGAHYFKKMERVFVDVI
jgi:lipopolysaccharide transport system permease protein